MVKVKHLFSTAFGLLMGVTTMAFSSGLLVEVSESESYVFEYSAVQSDKTDVNNFFIKELSKYNLSSIYNTRFTYHYEINRKISEVDEHTLHVSADIAGDKCTGNIYYKGFDISDILMPEIADFSVVVEDNGNYIISREFREILLNDQNVFHIEFDFEVLDITKNYTFRLDDIRFYSSATDREKFFRRIGCIDNYFASIDALKLMLEHYETLDFTPENLPTTFIKIREMERLYASVTESEFLSTMQLNPDQMDQLNFYLQEVKTQIYNHRSKYSKLLDTFEFLRINTDMETLARNYVEEVTEFCTMSQDVTYSHRDYYYSLSLVDYTAYNLFSYKSGFEKILAKTRFCNDTDLVLQILKHEIYKAFLEKSESLILQEQYHLAKGVLTNAENFYLATLGQINELDLTIQLSKANYGIYNSYLHLIDRAIDIGNYELAENYIQKARDFQRDHSTTIIANQFINRVSEDLIKLYINKGITQNQDAEFEEARYCFEQASIVCQRMGVYNHDYIIKHGLIEARNGLYLQYIDRAKMYLERGNDLEAKGFLRRAQDLASTYPAQIAVVEDFDLIKSELDYQVYLKNISEGKKYLAEGNYNLAYFKLLDALLLEEESEFMIYGPLPDLFAQAAVPYLLDQCKLGEVKVKKNELEEARYIYNECLEKQTEYGLEFERDLQTGLVLLNNSIFNKQCELTEESFEKMIAQFNDAVECGDFILADELLTKTMDISNSNYYCEFDMSMVSELQATYGPAARYQQLAQEAQNALESNDHSRFSKIYKEMEALSQQYEVIRKRIEPLPLHYLFSIKKNLAFLETSLSDYESQEEFETALRILQVMEAGDVSGRDAKEIQQKLAVKMAAADKATAQNTDPRVNVEKYTNGNSWYKHFKKAYIKNW